MDTKKAPAPQKNGHRQDRHIARISAVQALYQTEQIQIKASEVIKEFIEYRFPVHPEGKRPPKVDKTLFASIVELRETRSQDIDRIISGALSPDWPLMRLEFLLRAILRAGCAEMLLDKGTPISVIINEYVTVTHEFYAGKEPAFVNGVLDHIARKLQLIENHQDPAKEKTALEEFVQDRKTSGAPNWEDEGGAS